MSAEWLSDERAALEAEVAAVLCVEPEVDVPVVSIAAIGAVEDRRVTAEESRGLGDPPADVWMLARKLWRAVTETHKRMMP